MADKRLIPTGVADSSNLALNECIDKLANRDLSPLLVYMIDNVSESALPYLAKQFHVEGYEGWSFAESIEDKRRLLKSALVSHKLKGTAKSVSTALYSLGFRTEIIQSKSYNGIPYHFKLKITATEKGLSLQNQQNIIAMTDEYKNYKSTLDGLIIELPHSGEIYWGGCSVIGVKITIGQN